MMIKSKILAAAGALALATSLTAGAASAQVTNCSASGSKQEKGAVVGALAGGLLGNSISGHNRTTGTVLGALGGAAAGSAVGCSMQKKDERKAEQAYYDQRHGAGYDRTYTRDGYRLASNVEAARFNRIDQRFYATTGVNLRSGPTVNSQRVGSLANGEAFTVLAAADNGWYLVGRDGVGVGYVSRDYVRPAGQRYASY